MDNINQPPYDNFQEPPSNNTGNSKKDPQMSKNEESFWFVSACPLCGAHYNPTMAEVIEEKEEAQLLYVVCKRCQSAIVSAITIGPMGVISMGLISDLSASDVKKFMHAKELTFDDVLEVHAMLEK